jgi:DNA-binding CsgD family transcriptional regulator
MNRDVEEGLLTFVGDIHGYLDVDELRVGLLDALRRLVPSDWASLNEVGRSPRDVVFVSIPQPSPAMGEKFARMGHQNPLIERYVRTQDGRAYRFSDVATPQELAALPLYREVYAKIGADHQIAFVVTTEPDTFVGLALSRADRDYTDAERALLDRVRPFIIQAYRNAVSHSRLLRGLATRDQPRDGIATVLKAAGLTAREAEVVSRLAVGHSVGSLAGELTISVRTVNKHLQNSYRKLGVSTKAHAVGAAWGLLEAARPA